MAKPYANDLGQKVIQAIEQDGLPKGEASKLFRISCITIDLWFKRKAETGDIQPKKRGFRNAKQKISDLTAFRQFADQHQDRTQAEMGLKPESLVVRLIMQVFVMEGESRP